MSYNRAGAWRPRSWKSATAAAAIILLATTLSVRSTLNVDLVLVLALDVSASVDDREFDLQKNGLAVAIRHPSVIKAIRDGRNQRIAITVVQWSGYRQQFVSLRWSIVDGPGSAAEFAARLANMKRQSTNGFTHIGGAIRFSARLAKAAQFTSRRFVIDVSGDGTNNVQPHPPKARDDAVRAGITVNGLAIINEAANLDTYFRKTVIGGPGAFVITAQSYDDYAAAMVRKLIREINPNFLS